jgi:predicted phosphohydrolase
VSPPLRLAITADLHWGHRLGQEATQQLARFLEDNPPDVLVLAGDIGTGILFTDCLRLFGKLSCTRALVPGNHDLWVNEETGHDSLQRYRDHLPALARAQGFHYLDAKPLILAEADLALVGSINWYDYSWGREGLRACYPGELDRLQSKQFSRGRLNDANFIRWPLDDVRFTDEVVATLEHHLQQALAQVSRAIVITHHPAFYGVSFPRPGGPLFLDSFLWDAFAGNRRLEDLLSRHAEQVAFTFSGHTHRARENTLGSIRGYNVGGDYDFKRLLLLDWPEGKVTAREFRE